MDGEDYLDEDGQGIFSSWLGDEDPPVAIPEEGHFSGLKNMYEFFSMLLSKIPLSWFNILFWIVIATATLLLMLYAIKLYVDEIFFIKTRSGQTKIQYNWRNTVHQAGQIFIAEISPISTQIYLNEDEKKKLLSRLLIVVKFQGRTIKKISSLNVDEERNITMTLKEAGEYSFHSSYVMNKIFEFPVDVYKKTISPGVVVASKMEFNGQNGTDGDAVVTVSSGLRYYFKIQPKDRYGNVCPKESVDLRLFRFEHRQLDAGQGDNSQNPFSVNLINHAFDINSFGDLCLILSIPIGSYWEGKITYNRQLISGGQFDIISITHEEEDILARMVNSIGMKEQQFEGFAEIIGSQFTSRYMNIFVGLSPIKLQLYDVSGTGQKNKFKTYSISSRAKIVFHHMKEMHGHRLYCLDIDDDTNDRFVFYINHSKGRCFLALYYHYKRINDSIKFQFPYLTKKNIFFQELCLHLSNAETGLRKHYIRLTGNPDLVVQETYEQVSRFSVQDWQDEFCVIFSGQSMNGNGNSLWFSLLMNSMFEERLTGAPGMFSKAYESIYAHPNAANRRDSYRWRPQFYHLAGRILGKYLIEMALDRLKIPIFKAKFSRSILSILIGFTPTYEVFEVLVDNPSIYEKRFKQVLEVDDVATLNRYFCEEYDCMGLCLQKPIELIPSGANVKVTNVNRERYLSCLAKYYMLTTAYEEIYNFRTGFYTLVPEETLTVLDAEDLENILINGKSTPKKRSSSWGFFLNNRDDRPIPNDNIMPPRTPWESCREQRSFPSQNGNNPSPPENRPRFSDLFKLPGNSNNFQEPMDETNAQPNWSNLYRNPSPNTGDFRQGRFGFPANSRERDMYRDNIN